MPVLKFDSKEAIPEGLGEFAKEIKDGDDKGKWTVNVVPNDKMQEFRDNNIRLSQEKETLVAQVNTILSAVGVKPEEFDPDKFGTEMNELRSTAQKVKDGQLKASDAIEAEVAKRTEAMRAKHDQDTQAMQRQIAAANAKAEENDAKFRRTFIDRAVAQAVTDDTLGVEPMALGDITSRAYNLFSVEADGKLIPKKDGQTVWGEDGTTPMTVKEWLDTQVRKEAPYFFKRSNGGGANGGNNTSDGIGGMSQEEFNKLPPERRLAIVNEQTYKQMARK